MTPAYAYIRVSGKGQAADDKEGLPMQEERVRTWADANGYTIKGVYADEGVCGATDAEDRPAYHRMMQDICGNGVRMVLVYDLKRFARSYAAQENALNAMVVAGVDLINTETGENITEAIRQSPTGELLVGIQGLINQWDRKTTVKRLADARKRIREREGKCEGQKAYGEHEGEAETLAWMLDAREKGMTFERMADELNDREVTTRTGRQWTAQNIAGILRRRK